MICTVTLTLSFTFTLNPQILLRKVIFVYVMEKTWEKKDKLENHLEHGMCS